MVTTYEFYEYTNAFFSQAQELLQSVSFLNKQFGNIFDVKRKILPFFKRRRTKKEFRICRFGIRENMSRTSYSARKKDIL